MNTRSVYCPKCWIPTTPVYLEDSDKEANTQWGICPRCESLVKAKYRRTVRSFESQDRFMFVLGKVEEEDKSNESQS